MSGLITVIVTAVLFIAFGVFRRGREPERCGTCGGGCSACEPDRSSHPSRPS